MASTIYTKLLKDHEKQRDLISKIKKTDGNTPERRELWEKLSLELEAHAAAEEQAFYSVMMEDEDGTSEARHSVHEHQEMTDLIKELHDLGTDNGGWMAKFEKLAHKVEHHLDEEEEDIFPVAKEIIDRDEAKDLAGKFTRRKDHAKDEIRAGEMGSMPADA